MKTLILTCNTGEGHNSTATAIEDVFAAHGEVCNRADTLSFLSPLMSRAVCKAHTRIYQYMPKAFDTGYRIAEEHPDAFEHKSPLYRLLTRGAEKLYRYMIQGGYDTVVCTHVFSALLVTGMKEKHPALDVYTAFVATDYTCSPSVSECDMDVFFIPDASLTDDFVTKGVPKERIAATGLAVRAPFLTRRSREDACRACGLDADKRHVLMMCGSMGCGPMEELTRLLAEQLPENVVLTVICGTNRELERKLSHRFEKRQNVRVLGFVKSVPELMDAADLYLTKPGGISVTEASAKGLPMVLVNAVAGCEQYNLQYCLERGIAKTADTPERVSALCTELLSDAEALAGMRQQSERYAHNDAAERIFEQLTRAKRQER